MSQVLTVTIIDGFGLPESTVYCLGRVVGKDHSTFTTNENRCSWGVTPAWNDQCDVEELLSFREAVRSMDLEMNWSF